MRWARLLFPVAFLTTPLVSAAKPGQAQPPMSYICLEADSGLVVKESHADLPRPAASMVKMMLFLLVAEGLEQRVWSLDTPIRVSTNAQQTGGSEVKLRAGEKYPLRELMLAVAVVSANDAATAVAEALWGSEANYLAGANRRARELGMEDTLFRSVHGLPPKNAENHDRTSARDMAILAQWCVRKPVILEWTKQQTFAPGPTNPSLDNTNKLLGRMPDSDGLKTGYTRAAGYCVAATAKRNDIRLLAVVMGHDTAEGRFDLAEELLEEGFNQLRRVRCLAKGQAVGPPLSVPNSTPGTVQPVAADDLWVAVPEKDLNQLEVVATRPDRLRAPLTQGTVIGQASLELRGQALARVSLVLPRSIEAARWFHNLLRSAEPE